VPKYQQIFCNTEFGSLKFTPQETAIICELLLRGPQTPGELRARIPRMAPLPDPAGVEGLLDALAARPEGALVAQLPREPGRRDSRWANLFEELPVVEAATEPLPRAAAPVARASPTDLEARVAALESTLEELRSEIAALRRDPR
jgi:uncharacterized protein YceH (UPF0502 family)